MESFGLIDIITFLGFIALVIAVSLYASRKGTQDGEDYFLAGRQLNFWLIGFSLLASNISSEHFIGMSGKGFELGLAIASYEWMAAVTLVLVALWLLPRFLRSGIYTMPEFLEYRYNQNARTIMAVFMMLVYVLVTLATVLYSGALALHTLFDLPMQTGIWTIGLIAGIYTMIGGLRAVVWSDLIQGGALLLGGLLVMVLGFREVGGVASFLESSKDQLHTILPANHPEMPWVAVFIGGLWIPNLFYWGLNQFITQRSLAAKSLEEGQKGILLGASLKILIPFIVVFPGMMARTLYASEIDSMDKAYPVLLNHLLPQGLKGFMFAALFGAVLSTLDSLLNSASTIFTMDVYRNLIRKQSTPKHLMRVGQISTLFLMIIGCLYAPFLGRFESVFDYIQKFWGFITPGIVAVFVLGLLWKKVPAHAAIAGMLLNIPIYAACLWYDASLPPGEQVAFLHYMALTFLIIVGYMTIATFLRPQLKTVSFPVRMDVPSAPSMIVKIWSLIIIGIVAALYVVFA